MKTTGLACSIVLALALTACSDSSVEEAAEFADNAVKKTGEATEETMNKVKKVVAESEVTKKAEEMKSDAAEAIQELEQETTQTSQEMAEKAADSLGDVTAPIDRSDDEMVEEDLTKELAIEEDLAGQKRGAFVNDTTETADSSGENSEQPRSSGDSVLVAVSMEDGTALAKESGCFACHAIDRKVLGPAWQDVAARYADDQAAGKTHLLNKVAKGGSGAWADQGIAVAMPPYSPRVSDENIETLVDFILSL